MNVCRFEYKYIWQFCSQIDYYPVLCESLFLKLENKYLIFLPHSQERSHGVMVSTLDFESSDPSSNLGRTLTCWLRGATVARLTPDQKAACSNHVGVKIFFPQVDNDTFVQKACLQWGLNSWPLVYKTNALPLSYRGPCWVAPSIGAARYRWPIKSE